MKKKRLLFLLVLLLSAGLAAAQGYKPPRGKGKGKGKTAAPKGKAPAKVFAPLGAIRNETGEDDPDAPRRLVIRKVRIDKPVMVFYRQASPGRVAQQLIMDEEDLALLHYLTPDQLVSRREVYVDGLSNLALPGTDDKKFRLLGTSNLVSGDPQPAGDGQSVYVRIKVPSPGFLYVVQESAEDYRHFVRSPQKQGSMLDFQVNGLPGVDSVRAVYTLRRMDSAERGAGTGETIR